MVDMGAGTGLLSLMVAQKAQPDATIHAVENNLEALGYLIENISSSPFSQIVQPHPAEIVRFAEARAGQMDLAFANPPFFRGIRRKDNDGLNAALHMEAGLPEAWTKAAATILNTGGRLYIMWPPDMMDQWIALAQHAGLGVLQLWNLAHSEGHKPIRTVALAQKGHAGDARPEARTVYVRQRDSTLWTPEFYQLMRGYYLGLH